MARHPEQRIAGAPISWGVCEVPGWGHQLSPQRVLTEMREVGLAATEVGPDGFLPADPAKLAHTLAEHDLHAVGGFVPVVLDDEGWATLLGNLDRLAALAANRGIAAVLHPHVGTMVEGPDDVRKVLDGSGIALCLDTGHPSGSPTRT